LDVPYIPSSLQVQIPLPYLNMKNLKAANLTLYRVTALAFLVMALPAFLQAQSLYSLTPTSEINRAKFKKVLPQTRPSAQTKIKPTDFQKHQDRWFSLSRTPTPISLNNSKIKPLQPDKNHPVIKSSKFSAWQMKFPKNKNSIYIGKDGKAASVLSALTPVATNK